MMKLRINWLWAAVFGLLLAVSANADTITFQQGVSGYSGTDDAEIDGVSPRDDVKHGSFATISLRVNGSTASDLDREYENSVLRFGNISIPGGQWVQSAAITLTVSGVNVGGGTGHDVEVEGYALVRDWNESQVTWNDATSATAWQVGGAKGANDRGSLQDTVPVDVTTIAAGDLVVIDLSAALVQSWIDTPSSNLGVVLAMTDYGYRYPTLVFHSSENGTAANAPLLTIETIPEPVTLGLLGLGGLMLALRRNR